MRTIAVVSGAGLTTSSLLAELVRTQLAAHLSELRVVQATVMDLLSRDFEADLIVATVELPEALGIPVVSGMPLLLETNPDLVRADIVRLLQLPPPAAG
ncbi:PTS lactose transporter subunit IIB [Brachybacterium sp. JHP9]|uniref:PTS lactose transporter subunit IIB n=1 Tax=Brachybacterium equifaecis TaxID=2910770 RepID=A0ABT0QX12_9MICO|nr:PTS lactose transporter subunit IIB [Brachybacterium equifaecis]